MEKISLAMIVKNEEQVLSRCLTSIKDLVNEIIIVDTGSTDNTKLIAKKYTNKVFDFEWINDFSAARNYAFSLASCPYIMWLDADDVFPEKFKDEFLKLKENLTKKSPDVVMLKYDISFDENNNSTFSYYRERILKKSSNFAWQDPVHEVIAPKGKIEYSCISIEHRPLKEKKQTDRNLKIYESLKEKNIEFSARQQYYYSRELMFNNKINEAIKNFEILLQRKDVWIENYISACKDLSYCYLRLSDLENAKFALLKTLLYVKPRADIVCKLGDIFLIQNKINESIYWYKLALKDKMNIKSGAFIETTYFNEYPLIRLSQCYYKLNNIKKAIWYNEKVGKINPKNSAYLNNKKFFEKYCNR